MGDFSDLGSIAEGFRKREEDREKTEVGRLINRIMSNYVKTDDEWLQLREDVNAYLKTDPPEEDCRKLGGYTECLSMICSGIDLKRSYIFCPIVEGNISKMDCLKKRNIVGNATGDADPEEFKKSPEWKKFCQYCIYAQSPEYFQ